MSCKGGSWAVLQLMDDRPVPACVVELPGGPSTWKAWLCVSYRLTMLVSFVQKLFLSGICHSAAVRSKICWYLQERMLCVSSACRSQSQYLFSKCWCSNWFCNAKPFSNPKIAPQSTNKGWDFILWENSIVKCPFFFPQSLGGYISYSRRYFRKQLRGWGLPCWIDFCMLGRDARCIKRTGWILLLCSLEPTDAQYQLACSLGHLMYLNKRGTRSKQHLMINRKDELCCDLRAESYFIIPEILWEKVKWRIQTPRALSPLDKRTTQRKTGKSIKHVICFMEFSVFHLKINQKNTTGGGESVIICQH